MKDELSASFSHLNLSHKGVDDETDRAPNSDR